MEVAALRKRILIKQKNLSTVMPLILGGAGGGGGPEPPAKAWGPQTLPNPVFAMFWGRAHALEKCTTWAQDAADHGTRQ